MKKPAAKDLVYDREGVISGIRTGYTRRCSMEGCRGLRHQVRWPDGKTTWPCGKGMKLRKGGSLQII